MAATVCSHVAEHLKSVKPESISGAFLTRSWPSTATGTPAKRGCPRSEEHTSELQSLRHLVCRLLLEKKTQLIRCLLDASAMICPGSAAFLQRCASESGRRFRHWASK